MKNLILIMCLLQTALAAPQLISFKDGKVGVNILGYHAEAGLGGGPNGGGLHASAGTPWGQNAAAGLGGTINGRTAGGLYAGAQATPNVGAGAVLGGDTSQGGYSGSEAYANGKVSSNTRTIVAGNTQKTHETAYYPQYPTESAIQYMNAIQKIRPPKKYYSSETYDDADSQSKNFPTNKPVATIVFTKTINKTTFETPHYSAENNKIISASKTSESHSLNIDSNDNDHHNHLANNEHNTKSSASFSTPSIIPSSILSNNSINGDNSNGIIVKGVYDNNPTAVIIRRERTKLRTHKHRRNHQQKRIKANRQRQSTKTVVKTVEQELQEQQQQTTEIPVQQQSIAQIYHQQQHQTRRQLIAPAPPPPPHELMSLPCDSHRQQCKNVNREVRSDVVQSALQIPIGILQSLQQSLGGLGSH